MFGVLSFAAVAFVAASTASAAAIPTHYPVPSTYDAKYLESYDNYHTRYLALGCQDKHNTAFFDSCCHPLVKGQSLSSRPKECTPSVAQPTSSVAHVPASSALATGGSSDNSDDGDCEDEGDNISDNTGDDEESCDNGDNEPTTAPVQSTTTPKPTTTKPTSTPKPTSTHKTTSSTSKAASTPAPASGQNTGGFATYFYQNGVAGACGTVHKDTDMIAAIDEARYGNSGLKSALCGKQVHITNVKNGKSVTVTIADDCPTCKNGNSIDLSKSAFEAIAPLSDGMVEIVWNFV